MYALFIYGRPFLAWYGMLLICRLRIMVPLCTTLWYQIEVMYQIVVTWYQKCQNNSSYVLNSSYCGPIFQNLIEVTYLLRKISRAIVDISINFWYLLGKLCRITITKEKPLSVLASNKESPIRKGTEERVGQKQDFYSSISMAEHLWNTFY